MSRTQDSLTRQARTNTRDIGSLTSRVDELQRGVATLNRKSRGTTRANAHVARLERSVADINEKLLSLTNREAKLGDNAGPVQQKAIDKEWARIEEKLNSLWEDLNSELDKLRTKVDDQAIQLTNHGDRIEGIEQNPALNIDHEKSSVNVGGSIDVETPWGPAAIVGIIAGVGTALLFNYFTEDRNGTWIFWVSLIIGVAATLMAASFEQFNLRLTGSLKWAQRSQEIEMVELKTEMVSQLPPPPPPPATMNQPSDTAVHQTVSQGGRY